MPLAAEKVKIFTFCAFYIENKNLVYTPAAAAAACRSKLKYFQLLYFNELGNRLAAGGRRQKYKPALIFIEILIKIRKF